MTVRFDSENLTVDLSVADLLEGTLRRNLGFANRGGYERLWLGQAIHSSYQERAEKLDPTYRREVRLDQEFHHKGWTVRVHGRADGIRKDEDGRTVVEEIKSVRRGGQVAPPTKEMYERQARLYAWLIWRENLYGEEAIRNEGLKESAETSDPIAELILIEIGSEEITRETLEIDFKRLDVAVHRRLGRIIHEYDASRMEAAERHAVAAELEFPYEEMRNGQQEIVDATARALEQKEHLLVEAPTGIGKTVAALYPALKHALAKDKRIFVLTAKNLQQDMASSVVELLNRDRTFHSMRLRAKKKMCANDEVLCHEEYCRYAKDYYLKLHRTQIVDRLLADHTALSPDETFSTAKEMEVCPFEVNLELAGRSQVVVGDYNYAFEPYVALTHFADEQDLGDTVLVIDEAHNLVDRGRGYYSPELSASMARKAAKSAQMGSEVHERIQSLCTSLAELIEGWVNDSLEAAPGGLNAIEATLPEEALWQMRRFFDELFIDYLEYQRETSSHRSEDPFVDLYFRLLRFLNALLVSTDEAFSHCVERSGHDRRLRIFCKDPSRFLGSIINRCHSVVALSATLSPHEFYRDLLGFDAERTDQISVGTPFPRENRQIVIDTSVKTTWKERNDNYDPIADRLIKFGNAVPGNCLALFPSYAFLAEIATRMADSEKRIIVQERTDGERARQEILDTLRNVLSGEVFLLAVAGGVFAEGVDYPGEMLKAVAVVSPCLPGVSLEQNLLKTYYDERFERGFEYASVVPGMTRVVQAAGRLIRSPEDTGIIALLDQRFLRRPYKDHLPDDWADEEDFKALVGDPGEAARRFFEPV